VHSKQGERSQQPGYNDCADTEDGFVEPDMEESISRTVPDAGDGTVAGAASSTVETADTEVLCLVLDFRCCSHLCRFRVALQKTLGRLLHAERN